MKQSTFSTKLVMFILLAGVVLYITIYAVRGLLGTVITTLAYQDTLDDSIEITGVVVREEMALNGGAAIMDVLPEEGERVYAGETVAILYQTSEALDRKKQIQALEQEKEQLQYALSAGGSLGNAAVLEKQIISSLLELRSCAAAGNLSSLESDALALRTQVLQWEFAYSASGDRTAALADTIIGVDMQIAALQAQSVSETTAIYAPYSGIFSGLADGLEAVLTPAALKNITVGSLTELIKGTSSAESAALGKLITGDRWYFAAVVDEDIAGRLQVGDTVTAAFSRDYTGEVSMQVERVGRSEAGSCVLALSSTRNLKDVTLLREQTASLIFHRYTGIRIPKQALRMETRTSTDPDTGEEQQTQIVGVYTVVGAQAEFKSVNIVREGSDYYLVSPTQAAGEQPLRAGDEIILSAYGLYDGKVVRT